VRPPEHPAAVRLGVLGRVALATVGGPITSKVRSDSYALLALLAAHPQGLSLDEIAADLYPDLDPKRSLDRIRTAITSLRSVLRSATGQKAEGFILFENGRYRIDPDAIDVDLWRMLAALDRANRAGDDDDACLAALQEAVDLYRGDFAANRDHAWVMDHATTYRHQILSALARIAELVELDDPDRAIAALERAVEHDPINEELYQRIMRVHGRLGHLDAVRRTLRLCEARLATIGDAEPSEETRRVAARLLHPSAKPRLTSPSR
jgi:DNA-binding SARP family transcriptional activator